MLIVKTKLIVLEEHREVKTRKGRNMLKKLTTIGILTATMVILVISPFSAQAAQATNKAVFVVGASYYTVNGQTQQMDAAPYNEDGRVMVPIRYLAEACGVQTSDITASGNNIGLKMGDTTIALTVGSGALTVNGTTTYMDVAPEIMNGRSYLPARYVSQDLGYTVDFDSTNNAVLVYPPGQTPPTVPQKPVVDLSQTGTPLAGTAYKYFVQKNISDLNNESFKINDEYIITGITVTDTGITISQINPDGKIPGGVRVILLEDNNSFNDGTYWGCAPITQTSTDIRNIQYPTTDFVNPLGQYLDDIHRIKYICIADVPNIIQLGNPLHGGN